MANLAATGRGEASYRGPGGAALSLAVFGASSLLLGLPIPRVDLLRRDLPSPKAQKRLQSLICRCFLARPAQMRLAAQASQRPQNSFVVRSFRGPQQTTAYTLSFHLLSIQIPLHADRDRHLISVPPSPRKWLANAITRTVSLKISCQLSRQGQRPLMRRRQGRRIGGQNAA